MHTTGDNLGQQWEAPQITTLRKVRHLLTAEQGFWAADLRGTAFYDVIQGDLLQQAVVARNNFNAAIQGEIAYWNSNDAVVRYGRTIARQTYNALVQMQANINNVIAVDLAGLTGARPRKRSLEEEETVAANINDTIWGSPMGNGFVPRDLWEVPRVKFARDVSYAMNLLKGIEVS